MLEFSGVIDFSLYFLVSIALLVCFKFIYALVTPHDEWKLVKDDNNTAAAIAFSGAIVGFSLALSSAAEYSEGLLDYAIWGAVGLIAQLVAFALIRFIFITKVSERIESGEISTGTMVAALSIAIGLLNGACMSW